LRLINEYYRLEKDFPEMAASRYEQNESFFVKMFSDSDMMKQVMYTVGGVLYERLRKGIHYDTTKSAPVSCDVFSQS